MNFQYISKVKILKQPTKIPLELHSFKLLTKQYTYNLFFNFILISCELFFSKKVKTKITKPVNIRIVKKIKQFETIT